METTTLHQVLPDERDAYTPAARFGALPPSGTASGVTLTSQQMQALDRELLLAAGWNDTEGSLTSRTFNRLRSQEFHRGVLGIVIFFGAWFVLTSIYIPPRFQFIPNPVYLFKQWVSLHPDNGVSIFTPVYYQHILVSTLRVYAAFTLAVGLGVPLGLLLGWNRSFRNMVFPVVELLRPIPPLAWVPLAVLMMSGIEMPVVFVTMLAAFFATVLNSYLGVRSINETYFRAAACLGFTRPQILRQVVVPGALPFIFTGLQIAMGVAWFSLVGGEIIAGKSGLGFLVFDAYQNVQLSNIFIAMITLGTLGYVSSAIIRRVGTALMAWQLKERGAA
ncbi:MAG: ABC transporter permease [Burkholderiaceae bacterium]